MLSQPPQPGARIGKYEVLAHAGTGGMGRVYKARDLELGRIVALKVLSPELTGRPNLVERFHREARHAARLHHKNIVALHEFGQIDGQWVLAMEFVEGVDLDAYITRKGQVDPDEVRRFLNQAARALDHAFGMGITHRDIKPANFLLTREDGRAVVKLTDFGLAQDADDLQYRLTRDGTTVGTVDYLSPEQARDSAAADVRSDIYSLGCTAYHMLAGQPPFVGGGIGERVLKHLQAEPPDIRRLNPSVPDSLWAVLLKMLAKRPEDRCQTPAELLEALKEIKHGASHPSASSPPPPRRREQAHAVPVGPVSPPEVDAAFLLGLGAEQVQAAAEQFDQARKARDAGNDEIALERLLGCCQLDPGNLFYRQTLRQVGHSLAKRSRTSHRPGAIAALATWARLKAARLRHDWRKVLECGEVLLLRDPSDVATRVDMAAAAEALELISVAVWMLEEAREQEPDNANVLRRLARLYERQSRFSQAIVLWELIRKADPSDIEAPRKINALAATETIARGDYRRSRP